jgi:hypothetical protein
VLRIAREIGQKEPEGIHVLVNNSGVGMEKDTTAYENMGTPDLTSAEAISEHLLKATAESWHGSFLLRSKANVSHAAWQRHLRRT